MEKQTPTQNSLSRLFELVLRKNRGECNADEEQDYGYDEGGSGDLRPIGIDLPHIVINKH